MPKFLLSRYRIVLLLAFVAVLAASYTEFGRRVEQWAYRAGAPLVPAPEPQRSVAVVAIDAGALEQFGAWPWPRDRVAAIIDQLRKLGAATIGLAFPLDAAQTPERLADYQERAVGLPGAARDSVRGWLRRLDTDRTLRQAIDRAGNVVLASGVPGAPGAGRPGEVERLRVAVQSESPSGLGLTLGPLLAAPSLPLPIPPAPLPDFAAAAAGVGATLTAPAQARAGAVALAAPSGDGLIPAFELQLAARSIAYRAEELVRTGAGQIRIGERLLPTASDWLFYPQPPPAGAENIPLIPVTELWTDERASARVKARTVIVGFTAPELVGALATPGGELAPVQWMAHAVSALAGEQWIRVPHWFYGGQRTLLFAALVLLVLLPGRLHGLLGLALAGGAALVLLNGALVVLITQRLWLPVMLPAAFLLAAQFALYLRHRVKVRIAAADHQTAEALRALAGNLQNQGRLDEAYDRLMRCPADRAILDPLYQLAIEYERRRQYARALTAYDHIAAIDRRYRDVEERRQRFRTLTTHAPTPGAANPGATVLVVDDPSVERPMVGRFQIECELGRGAMGVVYRGVDPKIGRKVAIKTLAFTEEFEGKELEEVKRRFFREAEAAGRLDHPNVVTIYDVGEEHDLAYIAMDYVEGSSLEAFTHRDDLLPIAEVLDVLIQVADGLDYAHARQVVHRDIKPGNIIYDRETGVVKVTDFGIARLTDESKTRSGSVLGSPAYMSPEQVAGKRVDGRSDLFSLGTTLYQLLSGELPFTGDSVTNVLYRIMNSKPKSVRSIRREVPTAVVRVVNRALQKEPKNRYQTGAEMAEALHRCL